MRGQALQARGRPAHVVPGSAGTGQHLAGERPLGQRGTAGGALVAVGVQRAADRAHQHRESPGGRGHRPGTRRADVWQRDPLATRPGRRRCRGRYRAGTRPDLQQLRLGRGGHALHDHLGHLGRRVLHGSLDRELDRDGRGRAAVARAFQPEPGDAVAHAQVLHAAGV